MEKVKYETAKDEFQKWADSKKLSAKMIEKHADDAEAIVDAIQEGNLVLNEDDNSFTQKLLFPKGEVNDLVYPNRINEGVLGAATKGIKTDDLIGQMSICYVAALTGKDRGTIRSLDSTDLALGKHIAAFFLL